MTSVALPAGSYTDKDPNASCRRLLCCHSELSPQTSSSDSKEKQPPIVLRRAVGIGDFADTGLTGSANACRGMWMMETVLYAVIGSSLYTVSKMGALNKVGTGISGSGFVRMTDNFACLVIIVPGTRLGYTYDLASTTLRLITDENFLFYGAIDIGFDDSYVVFLSVDGRTLYNSDSQAVSGQGPITFTTATPLPREYATDELVGMIVDHRDVTVFGERTSESFVDAGNPTNSPFSSLPYSFMEQGCHPDCGYTIVKADQAIFWISNDRTIRRSNEQTPIRVSNHGIESILEHANLVGSYAFTYSVGGHPMVAFTLPAEDRTLVYDTTTNEFHEMSSYGIGRWCPLVCYNAFGKYLVGDSQNGRIGVLDSQIFTEWGTQRASSWIHQSIYDGNKRISHRFLEIILGQGFASLVGPGSNPRITLFKSDDGGITFKPLPLRSLGVTGKYRNRAFWLNLGTSRQRVYKFEFSDPVQTWPADVQVELEVGT